MENIADEQFQRAVKACGGAYVPSTGLAPPMMVGSPALKIFDLEMTMHGLGSFEEELAGAKWIELQKFGITVPVLGADRVIKSKEAIDRPKDRAVLPMLRDVFRTLIF